MRRMKVEVALDKYFTLGEGAESARNRVTDEVLRGNDSQFMSLSLIILLTYQGAKARSTVFSKEFLSCVAYSTSQPGSSESVCRRLTPHKNVGCVMTRLLGLGV